MMRRILRTYRRMAHIDHHCDKCQCPISPGEEYQGEVVLADQYSGGRKIVVYKEHVWPGCDWPPEPEWEKEDDVEEDLDVDLKKAA